MGECSICGGKYEADREYCLFCWFSGRYFEQVLNSEERGAILGKIRGLYGVRRAEIWHAGEGMFAFAIELTDGRIMLPGIPVSADLTGTGEKGNMPGIPPKGMNWAVTVASDLDASEMTLMPDEVDDEGLVRTVKEISELGAALT